MCCVHHSDGCSLRSVYITLMDVAYVLLDVYCSFLQADVSALLNRSGQRSNRITVSFLLRVSKNIVYLNESNIPSSKRTGHFIR